MKARAWFAGAAAVVAAGAGCGFLLNAVDVNGTSGTKIVEKIQDMRKDLTPENEYYVGRSVATNILAKYNYKYENQSALMAGKLEGLTDYVNLVGNSVASAALANPEDGDRPTPIAGWHFVVVDSDTVNAMAAPGGYVFLTTGALKLAHNEDELACVLSHEVAHVARGHALGNIKKSRYSGLSKDLLKSTVEISGPGLDQLTQLMDGAIDDTLDALFVGGYSRDTEFEADARGLTLCLQAGYDPHAMVTFLETLAKAQDTGSGGFYATHPKASDRIAKLNDKMPKNGIAHPIPKARTDRFLAATQQIR